MDKIPDHVQIRLRMTEKEINEQRRVDRARALVAGVRGFKYSDSEVRGRYDDRVKSKSYARGKDSFHYNYHAGLARYIAEHKEDKIVKRYWNRQARKLEEKAHGHN